LARNFNNTDVESGSNGTVCKNILKDGSFLFPHYFKICSPVCASLGISSVQNDWMLFAKLEVPNFLLLKNKKNEIKSLVFFWFFHAIIYYAWRNFKK
jgi:hypothetical protein